MQRNVPEFRFEGFDNCWEKRRLKEISSHRGGTAIEKYFDQDGTYKVISIGSYGLDNKYVDQNIRALSNAVTDSRVVYAGELTMVLNDKTVNGSIIGRTLFIEEDKQFVVNQRTEIITPGKRFNALFAYFTLNSDFREKVKKIVQGGTQVYVNYSAVENLKLSIPSFDEQEQIGNFLRKLDHLITLQQRELDHLKETKKTMLSELFPKKTETIPGVRFEGFTNDWEQRKIMEVLEERSQKSPENEEYPLMAFIANIGVAPKGDRFDRGALVKDAENKLYKQTELNDFIYSSNNLETGSIGLNKFGKASISPVYSIFKITELADADFLGRRLVRKDFINSMIRYRQGVVYGQWRIHESDFINLNLRLPNIIEQRKIGEFLDNLDHLITLQQRKLDLLKSQKQTLLKSMFPR